MKLRLVWLCSLLAAAVLLIGAAQPQKSSGLIVHEWGTFLAMNGSTASPSMGCITRSMRFPLCPCPQP